MPPQWLLVRQPTHCPPATALSQTEVAPEQPSAPVHSTQACAAGSHTGLGAAQSAPLSQLPVVL